MWTPLTINGPISNSAELVGALSMLTVDPWTHGIASGNGTNTNLSFPNAVNAIVDKLTGVSGAGMAIGLSSSSYSGLASQLSGFANAFPMPNIERLARRAAKMVEMELSKYILVPAMREALGININALPPIRALQRADVITAAMDAAEAFKSSGANDNLTEFASERSAYLSSIASIQADAAAGLTGGSGWRFYAANNVASGIRNGHPGHDLSMTAIMLFVGSVNDLAVLTEIFPPPP